MRVKCIGFEGSLISLDETDALYEIGAKTPYYSVYDIKIRLDNGVKVDIEGISAAEIEVINAKSAG